MSPETQLSLVGAWRPDAAAASARRVHGVFSQCGGRSGSRGVSIVRPGSQCPNCGLRLAFGCENLPLLGWLLLRGRCRQCRLAIPLRYLLMEWGSPSPLSAYTNLPSTPLVAEARWIRGLKPLGARGERVLFSGCARADVGLLCRGGYRLPHIPHPYVDHDGTGDEPCLSSYWLRGWWKRGQLGDGCSPFLFPDGVGVGFGHRGSPWAHSWPTGCCGVVCCRLLLLITTSTVEDGGLGGISACSTRDGERTGVLLDHRGGLAIGGLFTKSFQHSGDPPVWLVAASAGVIGWASGAAVVWLVRIGGTLWLGQEAMDLGTCI